MKATSKVSVEFTTNPDTAYKFKGADGKWTQLLTFVKLGEMGGKSVAFFKPETDHLSTLTKRVLQIFIGETDLSHYKTFTMCKFYGSWEKAPHICGKDCPLGK